MPQPVLIPATDHDRRERAALAQISVLEAFGTRALGVPGTFLGAVTWPAQAGGPWHYWWQAHLMDAVVDAAERALAAGGDPAPLRGIAHRLLRGIALRAGGRITFNGFYDDMAWMALALNRLARLDRETGWDGPDVHRASSQLLGQLQQARTQDLGGGMFWNRRRDYKNTATTGPGALAAVRSGHELEAVELLEWLRSTLWDPEREVFHDGLKLIAAGSGTEHTQLDRTAYSYNSGPVLGAVLEVAQAVGPDRAPEWAEFAARIVRGADATFGQDAAAVSGHRAARVLQTHGSGDAGLFTGILVRYLALAAESELLPPATRDAAVRLVLDTADALWEGRREFDPALDHNDPQAAVDPERVRAVFSTDPLQPADATVRVGAPVELSGQIQAWTVLEAAARLQAQVR